MVYTSLLFVHIVGAVCGLGATFAIPVLMSKAKTVNQANYAMNVNSGIEKLAKVGSITLLVSGLIMGFINPYLFQEAWYWLSIVLYIAIQPIVAYLIPKKAKEQQAILNEIGESEQNGPLPDSYHVISKQILPLNAAAQILAVVFILIMTFKPF